MAYCLYTDVTALMPSMTFAASGTKVTTTQITTWIAAYDAIIDSKISGMYEVPVTGTEALKVLKEICKFHVAAQVLDVISSAPNAKPNPIAESWRKYADDLLEKVASGEVELTDATGVNSDVTITGTVDEDGEEIEPKFTIDQEF